MARIPDEQIAELKRNVSILHLCADHGIELKPHGSGDYVGLCPFHDDEEPSFIVTPRKNLFHCLGCGKGGSVIDLKMGLDGLDFRHAVDRLLTAPPTILRATQLPKTNGKMKHPEPKPEPRSPEDNELLHQVMPLDERADNLP